MIVVCLKEKVVVFRKLFSILIFRIFGSFICEKIVLSSCPIYFHFQPHLNPIKKESDHELSNSLYSTVGPAGLRDDR